MPFFGNILPTLRSYSELQYGFDGKVTIGARPIVLGMNVALTLGHLRNHAFLFDGRGWRLSPLYDVVPRPHAGSNGRLILAVGERGHEATLANALTGAATFGLKREEAAALLEDLRVRVGARWKAALSEAGIGAIDIERFANCFTESSRTGWQNAG